MGGHNAALFANQAQAAAYKQFRPSYPAALYDAIYARVFPGLTPPFGAGSVAVDVATGSGQVRGGVWDVGRLCDCTRLIWVGAA